MRQLWHKLSINCAAAISAAALWGLPAFAGVENVHGLTAPLGQYRLLVMCGAGADMPFETKVMLSGLDWEGFAERDLLLIELSQDSAAVLRPHARISGGDRGAISGLGRYEIKRGARAIRETARCKKAYEFALIGKDTGLKQRWQSFVPTNALYSLIDAMPMRKFEMKRKMDEN